MTNHPGLAADFVRDNERAHWHDGALWFVRQKRDKAAAAVPEWEQLREYAAQIKAHTIANLAHYLEEFERNASQLGVKVHWARDAAEHNQIVHGILAEHDATRVVKSKSMLTEECHLNPYLQRHGIQVTDSDLGEWIVQLRKEPPSHIVLPAIHIKKEDVGTLFHEKIGTREGESDPTYLTAASRDVLRKHFLEAQAAITGVNFAVAETGGIVVCTNEGNTDMGTGLPKLHIACMGIEKLIPRAKDLGVFLRLLARSATGQPITAYSSHFHGPRPGAELHIVLVDNGRSQVLKQPEFRRSLNCIRCGACLNTCPVYRRSGGHSYGYAVPGPIGSILAPSRDAQEFATLPYASSLCGSCTDVCPVKIDLHHQLLAWRKNIAQRKILPLQKRVAMKLAGHVLQRAWLFRLTGKLARLSLAWLPRWMVYNRLNAWGRQRDLPPAPPHSFRALYARQTRDK
ncbi:MAG: 4Fe-4S ferredoxin [Planctomycetales bacterium]|nr:4Fe-4S ferredoxin [Planctomycetales bacterium]NIM09839.1 4Fe-4S ferredoxin [Planctomycetales bacterium]NIN09683.1 4Fe-4S ferredoxin [Planctomycetales bacterium]NIN78798.1 4Fe-4S ferredoxin [Planctomycetales bacterium]NIO35974.1 4Fe-4S ferredoxin [Planctomycetales bacterium]